MLAAEVKLRELQALGPERGRATPIAGVRLNRHVG
jgi:hypothetical protein